MQYEITALHSSIYDFTNFKQELENNSVQLKWHKILK